jgi:hypothetical protein
MLLPVGGVVVENGVTAAVHGVFEQIPADM